jgi:hypothetical protein
VAAGGNEGRDLAIIAVDREGHGDDLAAPAGNQEDVRAPALVRGRLLDLPEMRPPVASMNAGAPHQTVHTYMTGGSACGCSRSGRSGSPSSTPGGSHTSSDCWLLPGSAAARAVAAMCWVLDSPAYLLASPSESSLYFCSMRTLPGRAERTRATIRPTCCYP